MMHQSNSRHEIGFVFHGPQDFVVRIVRGFVAERGEYLGQSNEHGNGCIRSHMMLQLAALGPLEKVKYCQVTMSKKVRMRLVL
jgi:hypothetical protein